MSSDGAHLGINAKRAMNAIVGTAPQPAGEERESPAAVRDRIMAAAARGGEPTGYGDCADMVAGMVLMFYGSRPEAVTWPAESAGGGPDLYAEVSAFTDGKLDALGITGFQWGWAVNAARFALSLPPEPNPAILVIGGES